MKLTTLYRCLLYAVGNVIEAVPTNYDTQAVASRQITKWQKQYNQYIEATVKTRNSGCTSDNIVYRQEWGSLYKQSRIDYTNAVQCLQQKPAISSKSDVPAYVSFASFIPGPNARQDQLNPEKGLFFHFHRYFTWLYEKALQEECGYKGTQPYSDWTISWEDPRKSTVSDGSPTSLGSNGESIPHGPTTLRGFGISIDITPGTGGGCVYSGPFKNYIMNLGPVASASNGITSLNYNPRCLSRDLAPGWSNQTKPTDVVSLISSCADLGCFNTALEALDGVHAGAHFTIGGIGMDAFASVSDPAFYLLHGQVDRLWTIWQNLNAGNRTRQVWGTCTAFNAPPSPNVTLDTIVYYGIIAPQKLVSSLVSTIDGPFCYMYI